MKVSNIAGLEARVTLKKVEANPQNLECREVVSAVEPPLVAPACPAEAFERSRKLLREGGSDLVTVRKDFLASKFSITPHHPTASGRRPATVSYYVILWPL